MLSSFASMKLNAVNLFFIDFLIVKAKTLPWEGLVLWHSHALFTSHWSTLAYPHGWGQMGCLGESLIAKKLSKHASRLSFLR